MWYFSRDLNVYTYLIAEYPQAQKSIFGNQHQNRNIWLKLNGPRRVSISSKYTGAAHFQTTLKPLLAHQC